MTILGVILGCKKKEMYSLPSNLPFLPSDSSPADNFLSVFHWICSRIKVKRRRKKKYHDRILRGRHWEKRPGLLS